MRFQPCDILPDDSHEPDIYDVISMFDAFDPWFAGGADAEILKGIMDGSLVPDPLF